MNFLRSLGGISARELGTPAMPLFNPSVASKTATFAMSWFWFPEAQFGAAKGVLRTRVGYAGGTKPSPTYYSLGDHTETVELDYDPEVTSYSELLAMFWKNHDPGANCSRQYMSAIFYYDEEQKRLAEETKGEMERAKRIKTQILPMDRFYNAEGYHQKYLLQRHPWLLQALDIDPEELVENHVAARLNGYVGGYGKAEEFEAEWEKLGLNNKMAEYVKKELIKNKR